jgi:hypothetical protein
MKENIIEERHKMIESRLKDRVQNLKQQKLEYKVIQKRSRSVMKQTPVTYHRLIF